MIADDRKQDARDRNFSIVTSCWRRVAMQKRRNNDIETNRKETRPPNIPLQNVVKFLIKKSQFLQYNLILAMLQPLLLLENVLDPESVTSLETSSLPSSSQQLHAQGRSRPGKTDGAQRL